MSDLIVFTFLVGLMIVSGVLVGMILARRIDRTMTPPPAARGVERTEQEHKQ